LHKAEHTVVVPAWSHPRADVDEGNGGDDVRCSAGVGECVLGAAPAFYFDTYLPLQHDAQESSSTALGLTICFPNEHVPHPLEQLQPCFDAGANAIMLLRLPLLVVDAISLSNGGFAAELGPFSAGKDDLSKADGQCSAAAVAASKNGAYM
jgi:hypothetical protein